MTDNYDALEEAEAYEMELQRKDEEIKRLREALQWQPIETAPKDGTPVLVFEKFPTMRGGLIDCHYIEIARWDECWRIDSFDPPCGDNSPTHWMPLPIPPLEEKE